MVNVLEDPVLSSTWSYSGNRDINPEEVSCSSTKTYLWVCSVGHYYPSTPLRRKYANAGCGYCSGRRVLSGYNDMWTTNPDLSLYLLDQSVGHLISQKSNKKVFWMCEDKHITLTSPLIKGRGYKPNQFPCEICNNKKVLVGYNDLWTTNPDVAKHLSDPSIGYSVTYGSGKMVSWTCGKHTWSSTVRDIYHGNWCPHCSKSVSKPEEILLNMFEGSEGQYKIRSRFKTDIYVPNFNLIIEYDGGRFHTGKYSSDLLKTAQLLQKGYRVVRIRENSPYYSLGPLPLSDEKLLQISVTRDHKFIYLENVKHTINDWIIS